MSASVNAADHVGLVWKIASFWASRTDIEIEDLAQEGAVGLMFAAQRFDPTLGYKFSTYAQWWINALIRKHLRDKSRTVRVPRRVYQEGSKPLATLSANLTPQGREPDQEQGHFSLQDLLEDESPSPEELAACKQESEIIWREVEYLSEREAEVLRLRFVEGLTLEQVGERYSLTRERIRQIEAKALAKLRERLEQVL